MNHLYFTSALCLLTFTNAIRANAQVFADDAEPNNTIATALPIVLGVPLEGRLHGDGGDEQDLYSFVLPDGGHLELTIEGEQGTTGGLALVVHPVEMDSGVGMTTATALIGDLGVVTTSVVPLFCLDAGAQLMHVSRTGGPCSYRITAQFVPLAFAGDPEPNDDIATATVLLEGVDATGHLNVGWPYNGASADYWRIDKGSTGSVTFHTAFVTDDPAADAFIVLYILDQTGLPIGPEVYLAEVGVGGVVAEDTVVVNNIMDAPGTYFLWFFYTASVCQAYRLQWTSGAVGVQEEAPTPAIGVALNEGLLTLTSAEDGPINVWMLDACGRRSVPLQTAGAFPCSVDLSALANGTYLAVVQLLDGRRMTARVMLQR